MSSLAWSRFLVELFGPDSRDIDAATLGRLVADQIAERHDLDYKREPYKATDDDRRELALDVAALANATGGLILVGIDEAKDSTASRIVPLADDHRDQEVRRIREVVAQRTFPVPQLDVEWVAVDHGGVIAITVPPSPTAPHAVPRSGSPTERFLAWPLRDGTRKRYLTEPEVADAYASRQRRARGGDSRIAEAEHQLRQSLAGDDDRRWMTAVVVPSVAGTIRVSEWDDQRVHSEIVRPVAALPPEQRFLDVYDIEVTHALRRLRLASDAALPTRHWTAEVHADGTAACATPVSSMTGEWQRNPLRDGPAPTTTLIPDSWVFKSLCRVLGAVVNLASGTAGGRGSESILRLTLNAAGAEAGQYRYGSRWSPDHVVREDVELTISIDLDRSAAPAGFRLLLGLVATDVWNGLGYPQCRYVNRDGELESGAEELLSS